MFGFSHVRQPCSPRPLHRPLHHFYPFYIRTINLIPHLHTHPCQFIPQQNSCINAASPDVDADACEGVTGLETHEEDITYFRGFGVGFGEQVCTGASGVEELDLVFLEGEDGFFEFGDGGWGRRVDF